MGFNDRTIIKKTRKDHKCLGCLQAIPIGSIAVKNQGKHEGEFYSYYLHYECDGFLDKHHEFVEEGVWDGCVNEIKAEVQNGQA